MAFYLAIDQGTTSCRSIIFNEAFEEVSRAQATFPQLFPQPGCVEHDPNVILDTQTATIRRALNEANLTPDDIIAAGITNQRETTVVWNRHTGIPVYPAIVWQDRRTAAFCATLESRGLAPEIKDRTGLLPDAYFSASKIQWILENVANARMQAEAGDLLFGTIDTWLLWNFTKGEVHATDASNASRTMLLNIQTGDWDPALLELFTIPKSMLPEVYNSHQYYGSLHLDENTIPVMAVAGDQQAALYGQGCIEPGTAKNTYGTGCFLLMQTGKHPVFSEHGLLTTIAWKLNGELHYSLEGSVFTAGAAVQWLRDELGLIADASETETIAASLSSNDGVYLVPAFTGMGAPWWNMEARGTLTGLTRGTGKAHIVRAVLESIAYQTCDVVRLMEKESSLQLSSLRVDGGATSNNWLMQFQSDLLGINVERSSYTEVTARGVAMLAAGKAADTRKDYQPFRPIQSQENAGTLLQEWHEAVHKALHSS